MEFLNICERCGMPIHHLADYGTNRDGSSNSSFCKHCYQKGEFIDIPEQQLRRW